MAIAEKVPEILQMMKVGARIFWVQFLFRSAPERWFLPVHHFPALEDREGPGIPGPLGGEGCHLGEVSVWCNLNAGTIMQSIFFQFKYINISLHKKIAV